MKILTLSTTFPSSADSTLGIFVKERMRAVSELGFDVRVLSPVPYFPPLRWFPNWYRFSQYPRYEEVDGLPVSRPRYFLPPKVGSYFQPLLLRRSVRRAAAEIRRDFDFDLIDAHWVYPNGVAATELGAILNKPVVITGRGEDTLRFPEMPFKRKPIRRAVGQAAQLVGVSQEIADKFVRLGASPDRVQVIPNGVDCEKFRPLDKAEVRRELGLPANAPIIVSVGNFVEGKGHHLLVEALSHMRAKFPDAMAVIIGSPGRYGRDYTAQIERTISSLGLQQQVRMPGCQLHDELAKWYSAADVLTLLSSSEGLPNVIMEALACGTPAVATKVGGIPGILADTRLGLLVPERNAAAAAATLSEALTRNWDRNAIRQELEQRSWRKTAEAVAEVFEKATAEQAAPVLS